jgi:ubiquinol-cytochrome c reductase cytochrome b subunit
VQSIPLSVRGLAFNVWGGAFPGTEFFARLFVIHEFLFPLALAGLLGGHLAILWHQKHTDFAGPGKTEHNIVGSRLWPQYAIKSTALLMFIAAVIFGLGGLIQINPIWVYGPFEAARSSAGTQPDWYVGWLDGGLRLWPHWEFRSFGHEIPNPFFPGIVLPGSSSTSYTPGPGSTRSFSTTTRSTTSSTGHATSRCVRRSAWRRSSSSST